MTTQNPSVHPNDSLIFLSSEPGDAVVIERDHIVVDDGEGEESIGTRSTMTECKSGEVRVIENYL